MQGRPCMAKSKRMTERCQPHPTRLGLNALPLVAVATKLGFENHSKGSHEVSKFEKPR